MKIYANTTGKLIRVLKDDFDIEAYGEPDSYADMLELDPITNPLIIQYINTAWNDTKLLDGILLYKSNPVTIIPPGTEWVEAEKRLQSELTAATIPGWATWTEVKATAWYDANVTALIDAIPDIDRLTPTAFQNNTQAIVAQMQDIIAAQAVVIHNLARMVIALRNKTWPNLEGRE